MKSKIVLVAALAAVLAFGSRARAATITFEGVVSGFSHLVPATPYTEAGFSLTNLQGGFSDGIYGPTGANTNGTSIFGWCSSCAPNFTSNVIELTKVGGGTFSLFSLDAGNLNFTAGFVTPPLSAQSILAVGHLFGGGTVTQTLQLSDTWATFNLLSFTSLISVDFSATWNAVPNPAFDNLVVSSETPLPAALPLFTTGLGALGLLGWRRKKKAQAIAA